jgi:hypothetical protein
LSPLTKLFVVLHVVLSLMLTAGLIVFVNRTEAFNISLASTKTALSIANTKEQTAEADASAARESAESAVKAVNTQIQSVLGKLTDAQRELAAKDARLAKLASDAALASADITGLTDALKASEDQKAKQADALSQGRADADNYVKKNSDLNLAVSDLTNKLEVALRERTNYSEQLAEQKSQVENLTAIVKDLGGNPNTVGGNKANLGAVAINGVIREVKPINGIPYATISVGSADNVQKGMQFNVIDRDRGVFLGQLTIDSVEPTTATGRLDGPRISDVHKGTEVKTQL